MLQSIAASLGLASVMSLHNSLTLGSTGFLSAATTWSYVPSALRQATPIPKKPGKGGRGDEPTPLDSEAMALKHCPMD